MTFSTRTALVWYGIFISAFFALSIAFWVLAYYDPDARMQMLLLSLVASGGTGWNLYRLKKLSAVKAEPPKDPATCERCGGHEFFKDYEEAKGTIIRLVMASGQPVRGSVRYDGHARICKTCGIELRSVEVATIPPHEQM